MTYEPTVWQNGDVVTAEKLNKLENGVTNAGAGGIQIIEAEMTDEGAPARINISFNELVGLIENGVMPIFLFLQNRDNGYAQELCLLNSCSYMPISPESPNEMQYRCMFSSGFSYFQFLSNSPDTYMTYYDSAIESPELIDNPGLDNLGPDNTIA